MAGDPELHPVTVSMDGAALVLIWQHAASPVHAQLLCPLQLVRHSGFEKSSHPMQGLWDTHQ